MLVLTLLLDLTARLVTWATPENTPVRFVNGTLATLPASWKRVSASSTTEFYYEGAVAANGPALFEVKSPASISLSNSGQNYILKLEFTVDARPVASLTYNFTAQSQTVNGV
jgi:hypothetical protein